MRYIIAYRIDSGDGFFPTEWNHVEFEKIEELINHLSNYGPDILVGVWELGKEIPIDWEVKEIPQPPKIKTYFKMAEQVLIEVPQPPKKEYTYKLKEEKND